MPNDCSNSITIVSKIESEISNIFENEIKCLPDAHVIQSGKYGIRFNYITAWKADYNWLEKLHQSYPSSWIKNEWIAEDGLAGVWVADEKGQSHMQWNDLSYEDEHYMFM
jgi:hypothetical protein